MRPEITKILGSVEKPYRYIGGEAGSRKKAWDDAAVRICLAFPDTYEMGMSNVGLSILYNVVNDRPDMLAERAFAPWTDMEAELVKNGLPLFSLESQRPVKDFDVLGVGLPYELSYTNILTILTLSQIPLRAKDRDESHPLVIAGGPSAFNPEPVADFFDAIVLGDGEKTLLQILDLVKEKRPRDELFKRLSEIDGVYVPSIGNKVKKAIAWDIENSPYPEKPLVAYAAVHDRIGIEVARGCTRGCRFCQAGFIYRPTRVRTPETATKLALSQLQNCGHEDLSFLSLSLGDYPCLNELLKSVGDSWKGSPINPQFPSLRVESLSDETLNLLGSARHGSFTLAPEAATERMRAAINKGNTDEDLYVSVEKVFAAGWHQIKLYFMIGLPGETLGEIEGIVEMANRCLDIGKKYHGRAEVTVSTSTFVPKSHTPLQWAAQISMDETISKQDYLKRQLRRRGLFYRWHNAKMSFLEGVFSRGDRRLSQVIEHAYQLGARFDAWDDKFDFSIWEKALAEEGIDPSQYLRARNQDEKFPWDHLYTELKRDFLWREYEKSKRGEFTEDCSSGKCTGCGVCDAGDVGAVGSGGISEAGATMDMMPRPLRDKVRLQAVTCNRRRPSDPTAPKVVGAETYKYRLQLSKTGSAAFLGHLEFGNVIRRALRRAGLPLRYSEGFHPHARLSFGKALAVGIESECEFCDVELTSCMDSNEITKRLASVFPEGVSVVSAGEMSGPSIERSIASTSYRIGGIDKKCSTEAIARFEAVDNVPFARLRGEKTANVDLKDFIAELVVDGNDMVGLTLTEREPMIRVSEALQGIFGLPGDEIINLRIRKTKCQMNLS